MAKWGPKWNTTMAKWGPSRTVVCSPRPQPPWGQQCVWPMRQTNCGRKTPPVWWRRCRPLLSQSGMEKLTQRRVSAMPLFLSISISSVGFYLGTKYQSESIQLWQYTPAGFSSHWYQLSWNMDLEVGTRLPTIPWSTNLPTKEGHLQACRHLLRCLAC